MPKSIPIINRREGERRSPRPRRMRADRRVDAKHWDGHEKRDYGGRRFEVKRRQQRDQRDNED